MANVLSTPVDESNATYSVWRSVFDETCVMTGFRVVVQMMSLTRVSDNATSDHLVTVIVYSDIVQEGVQRFYAKREWLLLSKEQTTWLLGMLDRRTPFGSLVYPKRHQSGGARSLTLEYISFSRQYFVSISQKRVCLREVKILFPHSAKEFLVQSLRTCTILMN